jgi:hypothetical protein
MKFYNKNYDLYFKTLIPSFFTTNIELYKEFINLNTDNQ